MARRSNHCASGHGVPGRSLAGACSLAFSLWLSGGFLSSRPAAAYEADTTLAGLTQQAALASRLHRRLVDRFGLSLGLFDPVRLDLSGLTDRDARALRLPLVALDPAQGYAPEELGPKLQRQTALGWLMAGSVLESMPAVRARNHFLDPHSGAGLHRPPGQTAAAASSQAVNLGLASFRDLMTGAAFDGSGEPSVKWLGDPRNDLGLPAFLRFAEQAVVAEQPAGRETATARMLMAAGAILSLLEQAGDPAYVHNDFEQSLLQGGGRYERWVANRYGRAGVPAPAADLSGVPAVVPAGVSAVPAGDRSDDRGDDPPVLHLRDLFADGAGHGLAERTALFPSPGTLPRLDALPGDAVFQSSETPEVPGQDETTSIPPDTAGYVATPQVPHFLAWWRLRRGGMRLAVDERCMADYAAILLPRTGGYARRALDLLFRGDLGLSVTERTLKINAGKTALGAGTLVVLGEGPGGRRRQLATQPVAPTAAGAELLSFPLPPEGPDLTRVVVLFKGEDAAAEPLIASGQWAP